MDERTRNRLVELDHRSAELFAEQAQLAAERAKLLEAIALEPRARRKRTTKPAPIPNVADFDRERARRALAENTVRRRIG